MMKMKKTCGECACFLPYFIVAQERKIPTGIISDPTNPNRTKMFCAKKFRETKEENQNCSEFLKRDGTGLTWQELDAKKEKREEKKLNKRNFWIATIALTVSVILAVKEILNYVLLH